MPDCGAPSGRGMLAAPVPRIKILGFEIHVLSGRDDTCNSPDRGSGEYTLGVPLVGDSEEGGVLGVAEARYLDGGGADVFAGDLEGEGRGPVVQRHRGGSDDG